MEKSIEVIFRDGDTVKTLGKIIPKTKEEALAIASAFGKIEGMVIAAHEMETTFDIINTMKDLV